MGRSWICDSNRIWFFNLLTIYSSDCPNGEEEFLDYGKNGIHYIKVFNTPNSLFTVFNEVKN